MKLRFTKQYRPASDLSNQQAVGEELAEYINHEYGLNNARIVGVRHANNPAGPEFTIETSCSNAKLYGVLFRLSEGELDAWSLEMILDNCEADGIDGSELADKLNREFHLSEHMIELIG